MRQISHTSRRKQGSQWQRRLAQLLSTWLQIPVQGTNDPLSRNSSITHGPKLTVDLFYFISVSLIMRRIPCSHQWATILDVSKISRWITLGDTRASLKFFLQCIYKCGIYGSVAPLFHLFDSNLLENWR